MSMGATAVRQSASQGRERLEAVPETHMAEVRDIWSAPSARRRSRRATPGADAGRRVVEGSARDAEVVQRVRSLPAGLVLRRIVTGTLAVTVAAGLGVGAGLLAQPDDYAGPTMSHSVAAGESVWSLAEAIDSERPLEQVVWDIRQLNDLRGGLTAGQEVTLPTR